MELWRPHAPRPWKGLLLAAAFVIPAAFAGGAARAATFTVTKTADTNNAGCAPGNCSLREAITAANVALTDDEIVFSPGLSGTIGLASDLAAITDTVNIAGPGATTLAVNGNGSFRVFDTVGGAGHQLSISGLTITGAGPDGGAGKAVRVLGATATLDALVIQGNHAGTGAGVSGGAVTISNSAIVNNTASGAGSVSGGGIVIAAGGSVSITNSTIAGNVATGDTGGDNAAGGGISNVSGGSLTITNSTIAGNTASGTAARSGGINGTASLTNTIVANNVAPVGPDCSGTLTGAGGHNLVRDTSGCTLAGDTTGTITGQDPLLGALASNGGPTQTMAITTASPAFNRGTNTGCPATDQRGVARPQDVTCDIGAFELQMPASTPADVDTIAPVIEDLTITARILPSSSATPAGAAGAARQARKKKRRRARGGRIGYRLNEDASVQLTVQRRYKGLKLKTKGAGTSCVKPTSSNRGRVRSQIKKRLQRKGLKGRRLAKALRRELRRARCVLYEDRGVLNRTGKIGSNEEPFSGRIGAKRLKVGRYRIVATATDAAGNASQPKSKDFRIIR